MKLIYTIAQARAALPDPDSSIAMTVTVATGIILFLAYLIIAGFRRNPELTRSCLVGVIIGALIGVLISYWCQPGMMRMAVSLGEYMTSLPELLQFNNQKTKGLQSTIYSAMILVSIIGGAAGWWLNSRKK